MQLISSMLSLVKNVNETDREYRIIKLKLQFAIKKAETVLQQGESQHSFISDNLRNHLVDARQHFRTIETLLSSSSTPESISFKEKIKLSLPFNNFREKVTTVIEDLKQATQEMLNDNFTLDNKGVKKISSVEAPLEQVVDREIENVYEIMGPTIQENNLLDYASELAKKSALELTVRIQGQEAVLSALDASKLVTKIEKSWDKNEQQPALQLYNLGRMNFSKDYHQLKKVYPDIDKISKMSHFKIFWKKSQAELSAPPEKASVHGHEEFFSLPDVVDIDRGKVIVEKEKRTLFKCRAEKWVKVEEDSFEIANGEQIATAIDTHTQLPALFFQITYN